MKMKFLSLMLGVAALAFAACGDMSTNTNMNANMRNMNANNTAILVNNNSNMVNSSTNRWTNTNVNRADYDRNRADYERDKGSSTIGSGANDSWLWFKTRAALLAADDVRESTINVDVVNDVVTLRGTVGTAAEKATAVKTAKEIEGVKSVTDQLKVAPDDSMTNMSSDNRNGNMNRR